MIAYASPPTDLEPKKVFYFAPLQDMPDYYKKSLFYGKKIEYIRDKKRRKIGVLVAGPNPDDDTEILIGWSKCSKYDYWNREFGIKLAWDRAAVTTKRGPRPIPHSIQPQYQKFLAKMSKYFHQQEKTIRAVLDYGMPSIDGEQNDERKLQ